jgi:hypothetical protein
VRGTRMKLTQREIELLSFGALAGVLLDQRMEA